MQIAKNKKGVALIVTILIMTVLLFLATYFLSISLTEKLISRSQSWGGKTYYLAEAGISEMVWLIQHDADFSDSFANDPSWATTTTRINPFGPDSGSYTIAIANTSAAHGTIVSTGSINIGGGNTTQRVVRTFVYRTSGTPEVGDSSGYADGNIDISSSNVNFFNGSAHSNNIFGVNNSANMNVDSDLKAVGNYSEHVTATVNIAGDIYAANYPLGPADEIFMPGIDFDYYKAMAIASGTYYTEAEFENVLKNNMNVVLNDAVTFVDGSVDVKGDRTLTINNGLLVVGNNKDFRIGFKKNWEGGNGPSSLFITHASGTPAGVLAQRHVDILEYTEEVDVDGVIYAGDWMTLSKLDDSYTTNFDVVGGLISRKLTITSCWVSSYINITHDNNILLDTLGAATSSQVIVVEHWEEEY